MRTSIRLHLIVAALVTATTAPVLATNGYFSLGYGTVSKGMGGAGVALPTDALAPATNPATIVFVDPGWDVGIGIFSPDRSYDVTGQPSGFPGTFGLAPGLVKSGSRMFPIPHGGLARRVGERGAFGLAMYGNGGMNTNYGAATFGVSPVGVDLSQMFIAPSYAFKVNDRHAFGVTALVAYQRFEAKGLQAFSAMSSDSSSLTDKDHSSSYGLGVRVGYLGQWTRAFSFGASYQTRTWMSTFKDYHGLFAAGGDFDIPSNFTAGIAVKPNDVVTLALDVERVNYSEVKAVGNHLLPNLMQSALGTESGAGFGWDDMTAVKAGVQVRGAHGLTWRGGYAYGRQPIPTSEVLFNILAPGVMEQHATFGLSKSLTPGRAINLAVMHAFRKRVSGPNPLEVPGRQTIELSMKQWEFEASYSVKF